MSTTASTAPDAGDTAITLANNVGGQVIGTAVDLAPVAVPFILVLSAIGWVLRKFNMRKKAGLNV